MIFSIYLPTGHFTSSLEKCLLEPSPICNQTFSVFDIDLYEFIVYFYINLLLDIICKYLFPFSSLSSNFLKVSIVVKSLNFDYVLLKQFSICFPFLRRQIQNNVAKTTVNEYTAWVFS